MKKSSSQLNKGNLVSSDGIEISGDIQLYNKGKYKKDCFRFIQGLILVISSFCAVFMLASFFPNLYIHKKILVLVVVTFSLALFLITSHRKKVRYLSSAYVLIIVGYFLYSLPRVIDGFYVALKAYLLNAKIPNSLSLDAIDPETYSQCATYFFAAVSLIIILLHFIALIIRIDFPLLFLATFPFFEIGVYWGFKPTAIYVFGVVTCWIITLSLQIINHNSNKAGRKNTFVVNQRKKSFYLTSHKIKRQFFQSFTIFISLLCIGVFAFVTFTADFLGYQRPEKLNEVRDDISGFTKNLTYQDFINILSDINPFSSKGSGGINEGKLGNVNEIKFKGSTDLEITVPIFRDTLYLKGYISGEYKNNCWISNNDPDYAEPLKNAFYENNMYIQDYNYYEAEQNEIYRIKDGIKKPDTITINVKRANNKYLYAPYMTLYSAIDNHKTFPGSWENIESQSRKYQMLFYNIAYLDDKMNNNSDYFNDLQLYVDGETVNISEIYDSYASYAYMEPIQSEALDNAYNIISNQLDFQGSGFEKFRYFFQVKNAIQDYFKENYEYTLAPGKTPDGEDFIDYFLGKQNKGYCTYFASAGTMLMRKFGFPARYVEGYAVSPTQLKNPDENGLYHIAVKDKSAHAWTEVFIKEIGWIPCEFTPGYGEQIWASDDSSSKADTSKNDSSSKSDHSSLASISSDSNASINLTNKNVYSNSTIRILMTSAAVFIGLGAVVLFLIIRRKLNLKKLRKSIHDSDRQKCIQNIYTCCIKYFKLISIYNDKNISDIQFASKVKKVCKNMNISESGKVFTVLTDLAVKANMSNEDITFDECAASRQILKKIRSDIYEKRLTKIQKIKAKWFYNLY